ncbi:acetolactate synthase-1/2/3 large subunit [Fluviicoccus keumensis]|uniref:Acetolactate synthase-1/2/3 large subunit n=1 Tax=Fluviicoccus keumensis TaxID=1435465 RepID=A0A4Q7YNT9_9GAMM|nr:thiamine pyrophosphate-binding protein [Fluviicoccus keumensis]RZU38359.1 acetolactate synthase-1/2/3 large subunit [Fluviicoccus keumensis]
MIENGDLILHYLQRLGVKYVFGVPGGSIEPFYNALARSERRGGPRAIIARHETGAAFMADGYARETGRIGVCCATAGPGATNLVTGVACAYADGIPLLVLSGQPAIEKFGRGALQDGSCTGINTVEIFTHCTRFNTLVSHTAQLEPKLLQAISYAISNRPGPVHLSIPLDVMREAIDPSEDKGQLRAFINHEVTPSQEAMHLVLKELADKEKVTVVIGEGAAGAIDEILAVVESRNWLFVTTPRAKGLVNCFHHRYRGVFGFAGHESAREALLPENAERVVVIGTALDEVSTSGWDTSAIMSRRLIHLSSNAEHLSRSFLARLCILGSIELMLKPFAALLERSPMRKDQVLLQDDDGLPAMIDLANRAKCLADSGPVKPQALMTKVSALCPDDTRVLMDSGNSFLWGIHYWNCKRPKGFNRHRSLFHIGIGFSSMGWAIGASVGVAAGAKGAPVVCFTGDGSMLMSGQEITVALQENLNVLFIVLNDSSLGMVKHGQQIGGAERIGHALPKIDFALMAQAMGIESYRIERLSDLDRIDIPGIVSRPGPCLLDVIVDPEEVPPMGARMKVLTGAQ